MRLTLLFVAVSSLPLAVLHAEPALMPWPQKITRSDGALRVDGAFRLSFDGPSSPLLDRAARRALAHLGAQTGLPLAPAPAPSGGTLVLHASDPADRPDRLGDNERYTLTVTPAGARLSAPTATGLLRGLQTFLQLVEPGPEGFSAPAVAIADQPRFPWRGLLFDVTSHFQPVAVIKRNLDAMEAVKLNVFHWHLTDDQGFRVESRVFPKLHTLGTEGDFYTQAEIRDILAYAHDRGIRVIPEFDMPGHCATWLIGYPELASAPGPYSIIHTFGVFDPALDPTREEIYTFIDRLLGEMTALFPDPYFHIGGDEVNGVHWKANPAIQRYIRAHRLTDEHGLQTYFNQRVAALIRKHGKIMMGWDEILHPDLPAEIVTQSWRDHESLATAVRRGHRALLSFGYYLDHLKTAREYYDVDPLRGPAAGLTPAEAARVLGGEACMWTEFVNPETIDSRTWPKAAAVAERLWSAPGEPAPLYSRLDRVSRWLNWRGTLHNRNYEEMLFRLTGGRPIEALRILADTLQPLGIEGREITRTYTQATPLNRLVDAARGEATSPRRLTPALLSAWAGNHARLAPELESNFLLREALPLSAALARTGEIGLEAQRYLDLRETPPSGWAAARRAELAQLAQPRIEVTLSATLPVLALVDRAAASR